MIYDYSTKSPIEVTKDQANIDFPGFYFEDDTDLYFIYPAAADRIIYNFSLGVFFKYIRNGEYENIVIRPIITLAQMGNLTGYTQSDPNQLPTLYYANGRLTLQHSNCRNIGWHPRKPNFTYVYGNILHPNKPKVFSIGTVFDQDEFNKDVALAANSSSDEIRLIELYYDGNSTIKSRHVSRSKLILGAPPNFILSIVNQFLAAKEVNPPPF